MKTLYESILDMDEKKSDWEALNNIVEKETGWTLSPDSKYILSGTMHFPAEVDTQFGNNGVWFESLVNCAKKYKLKIQPFGLLVLDDRFIYLLEDVDIEYICELKIYVNNPVNVDLSKIKSPIQRITIVEKGNSFCEIKSITLQKTPIITADVELYADALDMENIKDMNCHNLIINNGRGIFVSDIKQKLLKTTILQQLIGNNPNVDNFYLYVKDFKRPGGSYVQVKLKGREVVGIMGKSEKSLITKGVLEDFYQKNADYKQWYQKHM